MKCTMRISRRSAALEYLEAWSFNGPLDREFLEACYFNEQLDRFKPAIEALGRLPPEDKQHIVEKLNLAIIKAGEAEAVRFTLAPSQHAGRLRAIGKAADGLLARLDAKDRHLPTWAGPLLAKLGKKHVSLPSLVAHLHALAVMSRHLAQIEARRKKHGKGGARRKGQGPNEVLLWELFVIYNTTRNRIPDSGPPIGFGGPLCRFITAAYRSIGFEPPTDRAVKAALDRWRAGSNQSLARIEMSK
jgi:hypothetical protein